MSDKLNITSNRKSRKWSWDVQVARVLWSIVWPLARLVPRPCWGWRRLVLRLFRAKVGRGVHIYPSTKITMPWNIRIDDEAAVGDGAILYALGTIHIGPRATVSQGAHLCAGSHDITRTDRPLTRPPIIVEADAWIAADAFVGPGVTIGEGSILGARGVAMSSLPSGVLAVGNPARILREIPKDST